MLNGFFTIAEFALVKVRKTRLEELVQQGNRRAERALKIVSSMDSYLGATQLGITLASLGLGWVGEPAVHSLLAPLFSDLFGDVHWLAATVSIAVAFMIITFFHIVLGELVPKSLAIQRAEDIALACAGPLHLFRMLGYPVIILFNKAAQFILTVLGVQVASEADLAHSEEELRMIVSASHRGGVLDAMESELIDNVFDFADRTAREVMVPRQDMICLFTEDSFEDSIRVVREANHTRFPLCEGDKDHVLGMIHIRDLMALDLCALEPIELRSIMREVLVVPEGMSVAHLLQLMRRKRLHLAVVADEYGGTAGLVALEDIIEEIVGDIQDEHDMEVEPAIQRLGPGRYQFDGGVLLEEVAEILRIRLEEQEEDTIGGHIFAILSRKPEVGDRVRIGNYQFEILKTQGFRVVRVQCSPSKEEPLKGNEEAAPPTGLL